MALSQGDTFRTYEILAHLGQGGMGSVYLAIDKKLNRKVAIKMVKAEVISDPSVLARTKREGQVLSRLSHPSIARVYDMDWADSVPFMVQQYIEGKDLATLLEDGHQFTEKDAWKLLREQGEVLSYIHSQGITHRDIKPANIMIANDGRSILMDFGLALASDLTRMTADDSYVGTLTYCAPEIYTGVDASPQSDIYQLGLVVYEMLTGEHFVGSFTTIAQFLSLLTARDYETRPLNRNISGNLGSVVRKCCMYEVKDRPSDGTQLLEYVQKMTSQPAFSQKISEEPLKGPRSRRSSSTAKAKAVSSSGTTKVNVASLSPEGGVFSLRYGHRYVGKILFFLTISFICVSIYWQGTSRENPSVHAPFNHGMRETPTSVNKSLDLFDSARAFFVKPHGFSLQLPLSAGENISWTAQVYDLDSQGTEPVSTLSGHLFPRGNYLEVSANSPEIHRGTTVTLNLLQDERNVGRRTFSGGDEELKTPFDVAFSYDRIHVSWSLNGTGPVQVKIHDLQTGKLLKEKETTLESLAIAREEFYTNGYVVVSLYHDFSQEPLARVTGSLDMEPVFQVPEMNAAPHEALAPLQLSVEKTEERVISAIIPDGDFLYVGTASGRIYLLRFQKGRSSFPRVTWTRDLRRLLPSESSPNENHRRGDFYIYEDRLIRGNDGILYYRTNPEDRLVSIGLSGAVKDEPIGFFKDASRYGVTAAMKHGLWVFPFSDFRLFQWGSIDAPVVLLSKGERDNPAKLLKIPLPHGARFSRHMQNYHSAFGYPLLWCFVGDTHGAYLCEIPDVAYTQNVSVQEAMKQVTVHLLFEMPLVKSKRAVFSAFDKDVDAGFIAVERRLFRLTRHNGEFQCSEVPLQLPDDCFIKGIESMGNGHFVAIIAQILGSALFGEVSLNLLSLQIDEEGRLSKTMILTAQRVLSNNRSTQIKGPVKINNNSFAYLSDIDLFVYSADCKTKLYGCTFPFSLKGLYKLDNFIVGVKWNNGVIYSLPLHTH